MRPASLRLEIARMAVGLLAVTLLAPLGAHAQLSVEVQLYLDSVDRLYENLEYERALEQIASAKRLIRRVDDDAALALYEGVILADMGKKEAASVALKGALFLNPNAKLPVQVSPKVEQLFEGLRQKVKQQLASIHAKREAERQQLEAQRPPVEVKPPQEAPPPVARENLPPRDSLRSRALIPAIAGGVLLAAGGASWGMAKGEQARLRSGTPNFTSYAEVQRSSSRGQTFQTVGLGLLGAGVVGLGLAAGFYVLGAPETPLALGAGTDGTSAFVHGRWP